MVMIRMAILSALLYTALTAPLEVSVKNESRTAFLLEDFHILIPSRQTTEVLFKPSYAPEAPEDVLMRDGQLLNSRAKLNPRGTHLILVNVGRDDDGVYVIKNRDAPEDIKHITLTVKDCVTEQSVKYGETFNILLRNVSSPFTLEFRSSPVGPNKTVGPMVVLVDSTGNPSAEYEDRLSVSEQRVSLHGVTGSDEGSYAVMDSEGKEKMRVCLNMKEHQNFVHLPYAGTLKINLILDSSKVKVQYTPDYDFKTRVILDQGQLMVPVVPSLEGRLSVEGSVCILERVRVTDSGVFSVTDMHGFPVSNVYLEVEGYKLPHLFVAIIALLSLLVFLLLVCLISCLVKVRRRAQKARAIEKIAQQAGKEDGDDFRQVVHEAYARFTEESTTQSQCDTNTLKTEVDIKGLEVSKNLLEMSDSGVEFNTPGLPLDSDTDVPLTYTSPKHLVESDHLSSTVVPEVKLNASLTLNSKPSADQTPDSKPNTIQTNDSKLSINQTPDSTPSANITSDSKPSTNQIPDSNLSTSQTPDSKPSADQTPDSKPSTDQTPDSKPSTDQTPDSKPTTDQTPDSKPTTDKTPDSKPITDQTPDSKPQIASTDQTTDTSKMNANETSAAKPSSSPAPEPITSSPPEAAQSTAFPENVSKMIEPILNNTPAPESKTPVTEDHLSSGPEPDANLEAAPPDDKPVSPDQVTSKENGTT